MAIRLPAESATKRNRTHCITSRLPRQRSFRRRKPRSSTRHGGQKRFQKASVIACNHYPAVGFRNRRFNRFGQPLQFSLFTTVPHTNNPSKPERYCLCAPKTFLRLVHWDIDVTVLEPRQKAAAVPSRMMCYFRTTLQRQLLYTILLTKMRNIIWGNKRKYYRTETKHITMYLNDISP